MSISMHAASVPVFTQMLGSLSALLHKAGSVIAEQRKIDADALLQARLFPTCFRYGARCKLHAILRVEFQRGWPEWKCRRFRTPRKRSRSCTH